MAAGTALRISPSTPAGDDVPAHETLLFGRHVAIDDATRDLVAQIVTRVQDPHLKLPILPDKAQRALMVATRSDVSLKELLSVIEADPLIAARVVAVANSALYATRTPLTSLRAAVQRLGADTLRNILMAVVVEAHALGGRDDHRLEQLRRHSLLVAYAARQVCVLSGMDDELAFMCGLFHDVGQPVLLRVLRDLAPNPGLSYREHDLIDVLHGVAGERLMRAWQLPQAPIAIAMRHHAYGDKASGEDYHPLANVVALADRLAYCLGVGQWPMDNEAAVLDAAEDLALSEQELHALRQWMQTTASKLD